MKYESEILYDLMKRDGLLNPSQDNLPYESELKEKYVYEVEGAYPKLQDYRAEWLNYNKCEYIPADFPTESQTNQTSGTFQNVIPFAYDVATLKGQTLVNIVNNGEWNQGGTDLFAQNISIKKGKIYTVIGKTERSDIADVENTPAFRICAGTNNNGTSLFFIQNSNAVFKSTFTNNENDTIHLRFYNQKTNYKKLMIIEGDHTQEDIPYFEGMQSVQMPVLTTAGRNVLNPKRFVSTIYTSSNDGVVININNQIEDLNFKTLYDELKLPVGTYTITCEVVNGTYLGGNLCIYGENNKYIKEFKFNDGGGNATITDSINQIRLWNACGTDNCQIRVAITRDGSTTYEPYESNVLLCNEEVVLRGIGEVKDTLTLTTGEYVQRVGEVVLDGSDDEKWMLYPRDNYSGWTTYQWRCTLPFASSGFAYPIEATKTMCDKLKYGSVGNGNEEDYEHYRSNGQNDNGISDYIYIWLSQSKASTVEKLKVYLSQNPITVQYPLATESIKTVDLTIIDENNVECDLIPIMDTMNYQTSSDSIPPLVDLTVCVEATTQNLASFVHLEGVEENE